MRKKMFFMMCLLTIAIFAQTQPQNRISSFVDSRDGQTYRAVVMPDGKTWMAENLNFATASGSWCYDDDVANCEIYGRLYDWNTARTACPAGWRLPSDVDWSALVAAVRGWKTGGTKLKSSTGWESYSDIPAGTDDYGFSALPGGGRWDGNFYGVGYIGYWWTASEYDATDAWSPVMSKDYEYVFSDWTSKNLGYSVRCVRAD